MKNGCGIFRKVVQLCTVSRMMPVGGIVKVSLRGRRLISHLRARNAYVCGYVEHLLSPGTILLCIAHKSSDRSSLYATTVILGIGRVGMLIRPKSTRRRQLDKMERNVGEREIAHAECTALQMSHAVQ